MSALVELDMRPPEVIVRPMLTFDRAADDFLDDCARLQWSPRTIVTYGRTYRLFGDELPREYDVAKIVTDDIRRFLGRRRHLALGTVAGMESHLASLFKSLYMANPPKIARNPMDSLPRTRRKAPEDLDVTIVSSDDVRRLLKAAETWPERLAVGILAYLGPRRRAVALLRLSDYDQKGERMRFREKGGKIIWKPIPLELTVTLQSAIRAGVYENEDYLVPAEGYLVRKGDRDDRVIWRLVKKVAARAGVETDVHALRRAFAVAYLEANPRDTESLRLLMGHRNIATTQRYWSALDRDRAMEQVRTLSWADNTQVAV